MGAQSPRERGGAPPLQPHTLTAAIPCPTNLAPQFHEFLKKIPSSGTLASAGIADLGDSPAAAGDAKTAGGVPRVPSLDFLR